MERTMLRERVIEKFGTAKAFSEACGNNEMMISLILNGKRNPRINTVMKWCEVLGIDAGELGSLFPSSDV